MFAGLCCSADEFDALRVRRGKNDSIDFRIGEEYRRRIDQRKALLLRVFDRFRCARARGAGDDADFFAFALNAVDEVLSLAAEADDACIDHDGFL